MPPIPIPETQSEVSKMFTSIMTNRSGTICAAINRSPETEIKPRDLRVMREASERNLAETGARAVLTVCIHALSLRLAAIKFRIDSTPGSDLPSADHRTGTLLEHLIRIRNNADGKPNTPTAKQTLAALRKAASGSAGFQPAFGSAGGCGVPPRTHAVIPSGAASSRRSEESRPANALAVDPELSPPACGASLQACASECGATPQRCDSDPSRSARAAVRAARDLRKAQKRAAFEAKCAKHRVEVRAERARSLAQSQAAREANRSRA